SSPPDAISTGSSCGTISTAADRSLPEDPPSLPSRPPGAQPRSPATLPPPPPECGASPPLCPVLARHLHKPCQTFAGSALPGHGNFLIWRCKMDRQLEGKKVAILVADGFEQVELTEPKKALEQAGAQVKIVS